MAATTLGAVDIQHGGTQPRSHDLARDTQITVLLANGDGSAKVPLDMIVRVLDTANFDTVRQVFPLCSGNHEPCAYADNAYVVRKASVHSTWRVCCTVV